MNPPADPNAQGAFPEVLGFGDRTILLRIRNTAGVAKAAVQGGRVVEHVAIELDGKGISIHQPAGDAEPEKGFRPRRATKNKRLTKGGIGHLPAPGRYSPRPRQARTQRRDLRRAGHGFSRWQWRDRGWRHERSWLRGIRPQLQPLLLLSCIALRGSAQRRIQIQIRWAGGQINDAVDVLDFTFTLQKVVAKQAGLKVLITALEAHSPPGPNHAVGRAVLEPISLQASTGQTQRHIACGHKALQAGFKPLAVGLQLQIPWRQQVLGDHSLGLRLIYKILNRSRFIGEGIGDVDPSF